MPQSQIATVANFDFGSPSVNGEVLKFRVKQGGKLSLCFENAVGSNDITVSANTSVDGVTFSATSTVANGEAIVNEVVGQRQTREFTLFLREGADNYLQITASGEARGLLQIRGDAILDALVF